MSFVLKTDAKSYRPRSRPKTKVEPKAKENLESESIIKEKKPMKEETIKTKKIHYVKTKEEKLKEQKLKEQYKKRISELQKEMDDWKASDTIKTALKELSNQMPVTALLNRYPINKGLLYNDEYEEEEDIHVHIGDYAEKYKRHPKGLYKVSWCYHYLAEEGKIVPSEIMDKEYYFEDISNQNWFERHTHKWIKYQKKLEQIAEREWYFDPINTSGKQWDWIYHRIREYIRKYIYKANQIAVLEGLCLYPCAYEDLFEHNIKMFNEEDMKGDYKGYGPKYFQFILDEHWLDGYYDDIE